MTPDFHMRCLWLLGVQIKNKWHHWISETKLVQVQITFGVKFVNLKIWPFVT